MDDSSLRTTAPEAPSRRFINSLGGPSHLRWLLLCAFLGGLISALPNLISAAQSGSPVWIADNDEILYACLTSQSYLHHLWRLSDPALPPGQGSVSYPWIVFAPGILTAKLLRTGLGSVMFFLRIWGGISLGVIWFLLIGEFVKKKWLAASCAIFFLFDAGILAIRPIIRPLLISFALLRGKGQELFATNPRLHPEWRVMSPALNLGFALFYLFLLQRARKNPSRITISAAGVAFGLVIWSYFYFWTACILALAICFLIDSEFRTLYVKVGALGLLVGSPALVASYLLKHSTSHDWLWRSDLLLPVPRFAPLGFSRLPALLVIAGFFIAWRYRKDLIPLWAVSFSALALQSSVFFTGIEMEGFHWQYLWAYTLDLMFLLVVVRWLERKNGWIRYPLVLLVILECGIGLSLRAAETVRTHESTEFTAAYRSARAQLAANPPLREDAVIAGDKAFLDSTQILGPYRPLSDYVLEYSPATTDDDLYEREVLNAFLLGVPKSVFIEQKRAYFNGDATGLEKRDAAVRDARLQSMTQTFDYIASNPTAALRKYDVRYLAVRPSSPLKPNIGPDWKTVQTGKWQILEWTNASSSD
ncbi:MAG TPA: hypothetical protein VIH89_14100 [Candidatus Sulfotelmatobacter sp.]